jgi:hypothetical protein
MFFLRYSVIYADFFELNWNFPLYLILHNMITLSHANMPGMHANAMIHIALNLSSTIAMILLLDVPDFLAYHSV